MRFLPERPWSKRQPIDRIRSISFRGEVVVAQFEDGQIVERPIAISPRLLHGSQDERNHWRLIGPGTGVHWPDLDEDISAEALLKGKPSMEGGASLRRWLDRRKVQQSAI